MNILCAICQDSLEPSNDIFITPCGHVFHFPCLIKWLEAKQTCPQCRQKVKRDKITRIYFTFSNVEAVKEDSFTLQQKVDSLMFQIKLKETEYNTIRDENVTLKRQNSGLRDEIKKTESEITRKNGLIHGLKEQSIFLKSKCEGYDEILAEKLKLEKKLATYDNIKMLISSSCEEVENTLCRTTDISTLSTYSAILKKELTASNSKRKELRDTVKRLQHDLQSMKMERNSFAEDFIKRIEELEEEIAVVKSDRDILRKQLNECTRDTQLKTVEEVPELAEASVPSRKRATESVFDISDISPKKFKSAQEKYNTFSLKDKDDSDVIIISPEKKKTKENEENSPYLPTKSKSILSFKPQQSGLSMKKRNLISKKTDMKFKKSHEKDFGIDFDGFGGHSKLETFPVLKKNSPNKLKRSLNDSSKNKKMKQLHIQ